MTTGEHAIPGQLPARIEMRSELPSGTVLDAEALLSAQFDVVAYDNPITTTTYFASPELTMTKPYIRARQYGHISAGDTLDLADEAEPWVLEIKGQEGAKERLQLPLGRLLVGTSCPELGDFEGTLPPAYHAIQELGRPLLPYVATQGRRQHFVRPGVRITLDQAISYYGFDWGELSGQRMAEETAAKLEIKIEDPALEGQLTDWFETTVETLGGVPSPNGAIESRIRQLYKATHKV